VPSDFLIVTALPKERDACLERLQGRRETRVAGYTVYFGTIGRLTVTVALTDRMGNANAATVTTALISALRPRNVLLVGIAAGLRKQSKDPAAADSRSLGDVLVADQVVDYESARMGASGVEPRPFWHPAAAQLIRAARELRPDDWNVDLRVQRPPHGPDRQTSRELFGTVLSGSKVVADAAFANDVRQICPAAIGLEMERFGVASACHQASPPVPFLLIKGICDFADEHKSDGWQPYAADAAAAFAAVLIKRMAAMPALPDLAAA
jgi:nucleoside phosphorylase